MEKLKRAVVKEEFVAITGSFQKAVILNQMIYWSERVKDFDKYISEETQRHKDNGVDCDPNLYMTNGWFYKKAEELSEETMLGGSVSTIRLIIKDLTNLGFISERNNPIHKWDKAKQYRVNIINIEKALMDKGYTLEGYKGKSIVRCDDFQTSNFENKNSEFENKTAIPKTITETISKNTTNNNTRSNSGFTEAINEYTKDERLRASLHDFVDMRRKSGGITDRALQLLLKKLDTMASTDAGKIEIVDQSTMNGWKSFYPIKGQPEQRQQQHVQTAEPITKGWSR